MAYPTHNLRQVRILTLATSPQAATGPVAAKQKERFDQRRQSVSPQGFSPSTALAGLADDEADELALLDEVTPPPVNLHDPVGENEADKQPDTPVGVDPSHQYAYPTHATLINTMGGESNLQSRIAQACLRERHAQVVIDHLSALTADFCNTPSIVQAGAWEVRLAISPQVLPQTSLLMQLSETRLFLRFETASNLSKRLIYDNRLALKEKLSALLNNRCDIDIEVW